MFVLNQQIGIAADGKEVRLSQFHVLFDGVLVGYLPHGKESQLQALFHFPHDELNADAIASLELQAEAALGYPVKVLPPEQFSRQFVEEAKRIIEEDDDE
jgi:hypothetical protein